MRAASYDDFERELESATSEYLGEPEPSPSPEPEPLMPSRSAQVPFPTHYLGPIMQGAVEGIAKLAFVPPSLAAQSVLAACSLAVQPHFNVVLPTGKDRPTSLFLVSVAESGDRKSTSDDLALAPVKVFERELEDQYAREHADAALCQSAWDESRREVTNRVKKNGRAALEQAYRDLGPRPDGPVEPTIAVRTGTTQGLLRRFSSCRPSLGLMSDEGGSWLGGFGMSPDNRLATITTLSDFWDGQTVQILTAGDGFTALRGRRLTFHMMVQPIVAERLLGDEEALGQGFLSRMLVSHPESLAGTRIVDPRAGINPEARQTLDTYADRLDQIIRARLPVDPETMALAPRQLPMSARAVALWWEYYNALEQQLGPDGRLHGVKGFVGKLPEMAARLAANVAVFEKGAVVDEIDGSMMSFGIGLADFYLEEALRLFGQKAAPPIYQDAEKLSDWLTSKWEENLVSVTAISKGGPTALRGRSDRIREVLEILERHNHVSKTPDGGMVGGKKVRAAWRIMVRRG